MMILLLLSLWPLTTALTDPTLWENGKNIWVTLANRTNQSHMCVAMTAAADPFRTCLVGIAIEPNHLLSAFAGFHGPLNRTCASTQTLDNCACLCTGGTDTNFTWPMTQNSCLLRALATALNITMQQPWQEFELLYSVPPGLVSNITIAVKTLRVSAVLTSLITLRLYMHFLNLSAIVVAIHRLCF